MSSLCPHLFQEYLRKASEIIDTYQAQIVNVVPYSTVSKPLIRRRVVKRSENKRILKCKQETEKMEELLRILRLRMWGLENLISVLMEEKIDNWLTEVLFQAYVRHLVKSMEKLQNEKICDCYQTGNASLFHFSWFLVLEKLDKWLLDIGTSFGCFGSHLLHHPLKTLLDFIRAGLNVKSKSDTLERLASLRKLSSTESESEFELESGSLEKLKSLSTPSLYPAEKSHADEVKEHALVTDVRHLIDQRPSSRQKYQQTDPDFEDTELAWDDEADPYFYSSLSKDTEYILRLIESRPNFTSTCSISDSETDEKDLSKSQALGVDEVVTESKFNERDKQDGNFEDSTGSVSTQTSLPIIPLPRKRSNSLPNVKLQKLQIACHGPKLSKYDNTPKPIRGGVIKQGSIKKLFTDVQGHDVKTLPRSNQKNNGILKVAIPPPQSPPTPRNPILKTSKVKVATVPPFPRQHGSEELKAKKLQTPIPPTSAAQGRLGPADYSKWSTASYFNRRSEAGSTRSNVA